MEMDLQKVLTKIEKYISKTSIPDRYEIMLSEIYAIDDGYDDMFEKLCTAFRFGFEKGCRATKKAVSV